MAVSVSAQTSNTNGSNIPIDSWSWVYKAAICRQVDPSKPQEDLSILKESISRVTAGPGNTVLHLASAAGNVPFIRQIVRLNLQREFIEKVNANGSTALHEAALRGHSEVVELLLRHHGSVVNGDNNPDQLQRLNLQSWFVNAANVNGNTALHEAAQGGHYKVVEILLHHRSLVNVHNKLKQTPLFKACEGGHSKIAEKLLEANPSKLLDKSSDGRTCLHAVINGGHKGLLKYLLTYYNEKNLGHERRDLLKEIDGKGNTVLHLAARRNRLDMVKVLLEREPDLSYSVNNDKETAICVALKLGFLKIVEELLKCRPDSIQIASKNRKNILHLAVELSQVKILKFLVENEDLSQLINQPDEAPPIDNTDGQEDGNQSGGDTPLHIAARNKNIYMVELLVNVPGVNKNAVNSAGLTPLDIAKENTKYHEPFKIIEKLSVYPERNKPFLYSAPTMSQQKKEEAVEIVNKIFAERGQAELVVAVLLVTMAFTAVFTVPGSFHTEKDMLGVPVLIGFHSFKLFLIFDCLAFFLSLLVVFMWETNTPLTTTDKMLFMYITNVALAAACGFTVFGLMAALYMVLAHKVKTFAWIVLGSSMFIALCGTLVFINIVVKLTVRRARFHRLCGVPRFLDDIVENVWVKAETNGFTDFARTFDECCYKLVTK